MIKICSPHSGIKLTNVAIKVPIKAPKLTDPDQYVAAITALPPPHSGNAPRIDANDICVYFALQNIHKYQIQILFSSLT